MDDNMTQVELYVFLSTLADNVEAKAETAKEAAAIIRQMADTLKPKS